MFGFLFLAVTETRGFIAAKKKKESVTKNSNHTLQRKDGREGKKGNSIEIYILDFFSSSFFFFFTIYLFLLLSLA